MCAISIRTFLFVLNFLCTSATRVIATATRTPAWLKVHQLCGNHCTKWHWCMGTGGDEDGKCTIT